MVEEVILHIGLHKTGTTSIQQFVQDNREKLQTLGLDFYQGMVIPQNHVELHAAAMRPERESGYKNRSGLIVDASYQQSVKDRVITFLEQSPCRRVLFSNEGLSLLRYEDELFSLRKMLSTVTIRVIIFLREPHEYLASYERELRKNPQTMPVILTSDSFAYTKSDSWLADYQYRLSVFEQVFGKSNVKILDYEKCCETEGSVIPAFLRALELGDAFNESDWLKYRLNKS